jgi:hypothetical protein
VALDEVCDRDDEAFDRGQPRREPEQHSRERPEHLLCRTAQRAAGQDETRSEEVEGHDAQDRPDLGGRRPPHVHRGVQRDHHQVADAERDPLAVVGLGDRQRHDEEAAHPAEQQQPEAKSVGGDRVGQPRVAVVHPPHQQQHHHDVQEGLAIHALDEQPGQLRDREDEDEIEKELQRRDPYAAFEGSGHGPTIVPRSDRDSPADSVGARRLEPVLRTLVIPAPWPVWSA